MVDFGSHLPVLTKVALMTTGPILEMGMGYNSSLFLHWICATRHRPIVSYENDYEWYKTFGRYFDSEYYKTRWDFHKALFVDEWDKADIEKPWDLAFLDHRPAERRIVDIKRLANFAKFIIIHDAEGRRDSFFHYTQIYPLFKWKYFYHNYLPKTAVLSNFVDLTNFSV